MKIIINLIEQQQQQHLANLCKYLVLFRVNLRVGDDQIGDEQRVGDDIESQEAEKRF